MSLMQLLSVGRSLCGIRDEPSRYKMTQDNLLPKFGSPPEVGKNDAAQEPVRSTSLKAMEGPKQDKKSNVGREEGIRMRLLVLAGKVDPPVRPAPSGPAPAQAFPSGRWTMPKNPFTTKSGPSHPAKGPVQGELC